MFLIQGYCIPKCLEFTQFCFLFLAILRYFENTKQKKKNTSPAFTIAKVNIFQVINIFNELPCRNLQWKIFTMCDVYKSFYYHRHFMSTWLKKSSQDIVTFLSNIFEGELEFAFFIQLVFIIAVRYFNFFNFIMRFLGSKIFKSQRKGKNSHLKKKKVFLPRYPNC